MELRYSSFGAVRCLICLSLLETFAPNLLTLGAHSSRQQQKGALQPRLLRTSVTSHLNGVQEDETSSVLGSPTAPSLQSSIVETAKVFTSCEMHFDECWQKDAGAWAGPAPCAATATVCQNLLCTKFLEANCTSMVSPSTVIRCNSIEGMCRALHLNVLPQRSGGLLVDKEPQQSGGPLVEKGPPEAVPPERQLSRTHFKVVDSANETPASSANAAKPDADEADDPTSSMVTLLHIPKTGGTAIEEAAMAKGVRWGMYLMQGRMELAKHGEWTWYCQLYHTPPALLEDAAVYTDADTFCVTRHPYERAISEYTYMLSVPWGDSLPTAGHCEASSLNSYLQEKMRDYMKGPYMKYSHDCHFVPQSEYIWGKGRRWCHDIFRFDDFPDKFNLLMRSKGSSVRVHADKQVNAFHDICPNMSVAMLDNQTLALLQEVYANDFEPLGYSKDGGWFETDYSVPPPGMGTGEHKPARAASPTTNGSTSHTVLSEDARENVNQTQKETFVHQQRFKGPKEAGQDSSAPPRWDALPLQVLLLFFTLLRC